MSFLIVVFDGAATDNLYKTDPGDLRSFGPFDTEEEALEWVELLIRQYEPDPQWNRNEGCLEDMALVIDLDVRRIPTTDDLWVGTVDDPTPEQERVLNRLVPSWTS